jgi:Family of unknown function (DUF6058)
MSNLAAYLAKNFLDAQHFSAACQLAPGELFQWVKRRLIPAPSYVVSRCSRVRSFAFGEMDAPGAIDGDYFHPANLVWADRARHVIVEMGPSRAHQTLKKRFAENLQTAFVDLNTSTWRLRDSFNDDSSVIANGIRARIDSIWTHFLQGTFGLCVANPVSEMAIATKEVLQEKLNHFSDGGNKTNYTETETQTMLELIDAYAHTAMPFSPIEYPVSSRKRLVDDLRTRLTDIKRLSPVAGPTTRSRGQAGILR